MVARGSLRGMACGVLLAGSLSVHATAADIRVAVAVNFMEPIKEIGVTFQKASGHKLVLSFGATGQFYAQIAQGAPFEILLSADAATPAKAIREGHAVPETAFTYAVGKLVLYSGTPQLTLGEATLREGAFTKVAIANPATAPYGAAAVETLKSLGLHDAVERKLVLGNNIAQTLQFIDTGHAEIGFVALSQVIMGSSGSRWVVPAHLYTPIAQDAVLLKPGAESAAAKHFLAFLQRAESRAVIEKFGYGTGQ